MTRRSVFLAAVLAVASLGAMAQNHNQASTPQGNDNSDNSAQRTVTVTGCLSSSGAGVYTLSDAQGITYTLAGNTDTLQGHANQEIEVTGQQAFGSSSSSGAASAPGANSRTINVTTTRFLADHCQAGGSQGPSQSSPSAARDSVPAAATNTGNARLQNVAQSGDPQNVPNGQLPQTSTILPLLGLIGLGSLVAGFFARR
jgi:hypothetical protein